MNAYVCWVKSYTEVSSRDYLAATDTHVRLLFGSWFRNPPKGTETRGKSFWSKLYLKLGMHLSQGQKQSRDNKNQEHYPTMEGWWTPLWPPTQCTCIPSSLCYVQSELRASALCWRPERRPPSFRSRVALFSFLTPTLFLSFVRSFPNSKWKRFFLATFSPCLGRLSHLYYRNSSKNSSLQFRK